MPYDLKKALGSVSKSPQAFAIYEGSKGMTVLIGANNAKEAEPIVGTGCRMLTKGKCAKNEDNAVVFKANLPPQKKWTDGLKKAFVAAGCASTHFDIEEEGDESPEEQSQQPSGSTPPSASGWKPGVKRTPPPRSGGAKEGSESEGEEAPTSPPGGSSTPPSPGWKSGVKPPLPTGPKPTPPPRSGGGNEGSESESEETPTPQPNWKPGVKRPTTPPPTPPPRGGGSEGSESEGEEAPTGRARGYAVSRGSTAPTPPPRSPVTPSRPGGTPPPRTGGTPKPGAQTPSTPPRPGPSPTPPDDAKLELAAREHLELRKNMKTVLTEVFGNVNREAATVNEHVRNATAKTAEMQSMRGAVGERLQAFDLVTRLREEAKGILEAVEADWNRRRSSGSDMMKARGDYATLPKAWPEDQKKNYVRESGAAFIAYDTIQRQIQTVLTGIQVKVQEIKLIAEEAESYSGQGQRPEVYLERLTEMNVEAETSAKYFSDKLVKLGGALKKQKVWAEGGPITEPLAKTIRQIHDTEIQAKDNVDSKAARFEVMLKRAAKIPAEARSDARVSAPMKKFEETAAQLSKNIAAVKRDQAQSLAYLNQAIGKMT